MAKPKFPPEYRAILKRWNELVAAGKYGITPDECAEMERLGAQLDAFELAYKQASVFEAVSSDYADLGEIGHLGGVEGL